MPNEAMTITENDIIEKFELENVDSVDSHLSGNLHYGRGSSPCFCKYFCTIIPKFWKFYGDHKYHATITFFIFDMLLREMDVLTDYHQAYEFSM